MLSFTLRTPRSHVFERPGNRSQGCGTSTLPLDLCHDLEGSSVLAVDLAPAAIAAQQAAQEARVASGDQTARRVEFRCADACASAWARAGIAVDVVVDKSTTDALLCDGRRGEDRVRDMYAAVGAVLRPAALVAVVSWRNPQEDGVDWLVRCVLSGLMRAATGATTASTTWALDIHSVRMVCRRSRPSPFFGRPLPSD